MKVQGSDGISFAIPIDSASIIIDQLLKSRRVIRPYIGIKMADFIPDKSSKSGRRGSPPGVITSIDEVSIPLIVEVLPASPAYKAGLRKGDVVLEVDGKTVTSVRDVLGCIGMDIGRTLVFRVRRSNGKEDT
eukprot:CAMPEP_0182425008 /NCGR_PEP_ID=MMETSP1167-20130531/11331_1 /TAXON_ID=2988 /ORGANISM="Mallomonas Sp, Strain CCMP3275" /LENGTH=131 /DNA_ID=CAMNT_0024605293 /DNA_START=731 /DNA_END=1122 /DNA_ORIENTATION=+